MVALDQLTDPDKLWPTRMQFSAGTVPADGGPGRTASRVPGLSGRALVLILVGARPELPFGELCQL
jgi:hypothetical protein